MVSLESPYVIIIYEFKNTNAVVNKAADSLNCSTRNFPQWVLLQ